LAAWRSDGRWAAWLAGGSYWQFSVAGWRGRTAGSLWRNISVAALAAAGSQAACLWRGDSWLAWRRDCYHVAAGVASIGIAIEDAGGRCGGQAWWWHVGQ